MNKHEVNKKIDKFLGNIVLTILALSVIWGFILTIWFFISPSDFADDFPTYDSQEGGDPGRYYIDMSQ